MIAVIGCTPKRRAGFSGLPGIVNIYENRVLSVIGRKIDVGAYVIVAFDGDVKIIRGVTGWRCGRRLIGVCICCIGTHGINDGRRCFRINDESVAGSVKIEFILSLGGSEKVAVVINVYGASPLSEDFQRAIIQAGQVVSVAGSRVAVR